MALISFRQLLDHVAENDCVAPAFNASKLAQVGDILEGAASINNPIFLQASTGAGRRSLEENKSEFDPRKFLIPTKDAIRQTVINRLVAFDAVNQISKINKVYSLEEMHHRYASIS